MVAVTTNGLRPDGTPASTVDTGQWAIATGTADAIAAAYSDPYTTLTNGLILGFRALAANTITTPNFSPDGLTAKTIKKRGGAALVAGDIAASMDCLVRYNASGDFWELLNPADPSVDFAIAAGTVDTITATYTTYATGDAILVDGLTLGVRSLGANTGVAVNFSPNGATAKTVKRGGGQPLQIGDIPRANYEMILRYNASTTFWELLNPATRYGVLFKALLADDTAGQNVNTAQPWFPTAGGVTVAADTTYEFEGQIFITRSAGTTSHTTSLLFGGTATLTGINYLAMCKEGDLNDLQDVSAVYNDVVTALQIKAASTSATETIILRVKGILRVNVAGTFIPQFQYSAAPGGTPTIRKNSFFKLEPIGLGSVVSQGTWA